MYWWMYLQGRNREADVENRLVDTAGEGESGTNWERTETYTLSYVKRIASGEVLYNRGSSDYCSVITWRTEMGVAWGMLMEGIYVYLELIVQQKLTQHYKAIMPQWKNKE